MKALLDSCTLIWLASSPGQLSPAAANLINDPTTELHVSHASLWEIALKHGAGKLTLPDVPRRWWTEQVKRWSLVELPLTSEALLAGSELPQHHKDPFDRVLLAQTQLNGLQILSPDHAFKAYGVPVIW